MPPPLRMPGRPPRTLSPRRMLAPTLGRTPTALRPKLSPGSPTHDTTIPLVPDNAFLRTRGALRFRPSPWPGRDTRSDRSLRNRASSTVRLALCRLWNRSRLHLHCYCSHLPDECALQPYPVVSRPFRTSRARTTQVNGTLDLYLAGNVGRHSKLPWASSFVLAPNKDDGKTRVSTVSDRTTSASSGVFFRSRDP